MPFSLYIIENKTRESRPAEKAKIKFLSAINFFHLLYQLIKMSIPFFVERGILNNLSVSISSLFTTSLPQLVPIIVGFFKKSDWQ